MLKIICNLLKNCDTSKISNECSSIDSIIQLISGILYNIRNLIRYKDCNETHFEEILNCKYWVVN